MVGHDCVTPALHVLGDADKVVDQHVARDTGQQERPRDEDVVDQLAAVLVDPEKARLVGSRSARLYRRNGSPRSGRSRLVSSGPASSAVVTARGSSLKSPARTTGTSGSRGIQRFSCTLLPTASAARRVRA